MFESNGLRKIITSRTTQVSLTCAALALGTALKADDQSTPSKPAQPASALKAHVRELIEEVSEASVDLDIAPNRPKLVRSKLDVVRVSNSDPRVAKVDKVGSRVIEINGKKCGSSVITLWMGDDNRARMLQINVHVKTDETQPAVGAKSVVAAASTGTTRPAIKRVSAQAEGDGPPQLHPDSDEASDTPQADPPETSSGTVPKVAAVPQVAALEQDLTESFPRSRVRVFSVGHRLIVRGNANNSQEAVKILEYVRHQSSAGTGSGHTQAEFVSGDQVVNLLKVPGDSQIRLKVQSVEMQREALRQFCKQFDLRFDQQPDAAWNATGTAPATLSLNTTAFQNYLRTLQSRRAVQVEDEPNHVVVSGQSVTLPVGPAATVPASRLPSAPRIDEGERWVPVIIPTVAENGRFRLEFSAQPFRARRGESSEEKNEEVARSLPTTLRAGESLLMTGLAPRPVSPENVLLLVITPELAFEKEGNNEPLLVPPERGRTSSPYALKQTTTHAAAIEAEQRSGNFYLSGPSGYSD